MSAFSVIERISLAATRLPDAERTLFDDLFVNGLTQSEVCESRHLTGDQYAQMYRSMMRSLCGVADQRLPAAAA